jgi:hypothetical protein
MVEGQTGIYVELQVQPESGGHVFVSSRSLPGLYLIGKCLQDMRPTLEKAIKRLFKDNHDKNVNVVWLSSMGESRAKKAEIERVAVMLDLAA